jgi:hypothetical protein
VCREVRHYPTGNLSDQDATAAVKTPDLGDGYATALTNFNFIANAVVTTHEAVAALSNGH